MKPDDAVFYIAVLLAGIVSFTAAVLRTKKGKGNLGTAVIMVGVYVLIVCAGSVAASQIAAVTR